MIDIGGGDSRLVDALLDRGIDCVTVLDISPAALARAQTRLGERAHRVRWVDADVTAAWAEPQVQVWHDRAVFHFLTAPEERAAYLVHLRRAVEPGGTVIIGTFAPDGPERCSGLPVCRYDSARLAAELGAEFRLVESVMDAHQTPHGRVQSFSFSRFVREV